ncbi:MAG: peptidoglycan DD-metalloendopeptidase family protein [Hyphomicrobiales bacterium]|nr:peptidoglycan DD-metalloendopeptidase family protein [Hyphomicrobiales bacterium]
MVLRSTYRLITVAVLSFTLVPGALFPATASAQEGAAAAAVAQQERLGELLSALRQLEYAEEFPLLSLEGGGLDALHGGMLLHGMVAHLREEALLLKKLREEAEALAMSGSTGGLFNILLRPVHGPMRGNFGEPNGTGGEMQGLVIETAPGAPILMPVDGKIVFSAPFQNYGKLLIVEAGEGYHLVLAGLERLSADVGEQIVRGEPVGAMGLSRDVTFTADSDSPSPQLYLEFRRRGEAVAPEEWVAERDEWKKWTR